MKRNPRPKLALSVADRLTRWPACTAPAAPGWTGWPQTTVPCWLTLKARVTTIQTTIRRTFAGTAAAARVTGRPGRSPGDLQRATDDHLRQQRRTGRAAGGDPAFLTGIQLAAMLLARDISSRELTRAFLARIDAL